MGRRGNWGMMGKARNGKSRYCPGREVKREGNVAGFAPKILRWKLESRIAEALEGDQTDTEPNAVINVGREKPRGKEERV